MKTPHTGTYRGKKVYVRLKSGESFIDAFHDRTQKWVYFRNKGKVRRSEIKAFAIKR